MQLCCLVFPYNVRLAKCICLVKLLHCVSPCVDLKFQLTLLSKVNTSRCACQFLGIFCGPFTCMLSHVEVASDTVALWTDTSREPGNLSPRDGIILS